MPEQNEPPLWLMDLPTHLTGLRKQKITAAEALAAIEERFGGYVARLIEIVWQEEPIRQEGMVLPTWEPVIDCEVLGKQQTQGSLVSHPIKRKDGTYVTDRKGRPVIVSRPQSPMLYNWRNQIAEAASTDYRKKNRDAELLHGALFLALELWFVRPKGHFGAGRNACRLKPSAPPYPITTGDGDKYLRAVQDALQGVVLQNDSQIVSAWPQKRWGPKYCTRIRLWKMCGETEGHRQVAEMERTLSGAEKARQQIKSLFEPSEKEDVNDGEEES